MAQLAQFFTTDAQRFSVHQERPRPAADDVAACTSASATRSTSQLAGWPASAHTPPNSRVLGGMPSTDEKGCPLPTAAKTLHTTTSSESTRAAARVWGAGASPAHTADT